MTPSPPLPTSAQPSPPPAAAGDMALLKVLLCIVVGAGVGALAYRIHLGLWPSIIVAAAVCGVGLYAALKLRGAPPELWFTFAIKLITVTAYKLVAVTLVVYLSKDCAMSDSQAQWLFGAWGVFMAISTLVSGSLTDALGVRRTLLCGIALCLVTRVVMIASTSPWLSLICGLVPLALGEALCTPVLAAATRQYTTAAQRSVAFSVFYSILNLGFMFAYFLRDGIQSAGAESAALTLGGISLSVPRVLLLVSFAAELLAVPAILLLREPRGALVAAGGTLWDTVQRTAMETGRLFAALFRHREFKRLLCFLLLIGLLKVVFNIMDAVLPTFAEREIGAQGAKCVGRLNAVNSICIMILAPLVGGLTRRFSAYPMVVLGGVLTALSFIFLILPTDHFTGIANGRFGEWFGHGYLALTGVVHPYLVMILFWQIAFSVGEAFYSPRVYEYAVAIAPKGQEASYASLSVVPLLMGKVINSAAFAGLLTRYCPAEGPRDPQTMWLWVGGLVLSAPLGLLLFRRFIQVKEEGREA